MAPSFIATAAVKDFFDGASSSASQTVPTADSIFFACVLFNGTSDTITVTLAAAAPTLSYQADSGAGDTNYLAVFVGAPSGSQTLAMSGADAGDAWGWGFRGVNSIHATTPFNNTTVDSASPASISITTTSDGLAVGVLACSDSSVTTTDTEIWEQGSSVNYLAVASTPGTGGSVSVDWSGGGTNWVSIGANLQAPATGSVAPSVSDTVTLAENITMTMHLKNTAANDTATVTEGVTMHMPIHLRMEKLS